MIRYRFLFSKEAEKTSGFVNGVDSLRRMFISCFSLYSTSKKYRFSFGPALPMGWASEAEYVDVVFQKREDDKFIESVIEKNLPSSFRLIGFKTIPVHFPSVESAVDVIDVEIQTEKPICDIIMELDLKNAVYDIFYKSNIVRFMLYYKKISRDFLKSIIDKMDFGFIVKKITRKNLYWIDSRGRLKKF